VTGLPSRSAALVMTVVLAGCGLPDLSVKTPATTAKVSIRNQDSSPVAVRWSGPAGGNVEIEACDMFEMPLTPGAWTFDVRSPVDESALPIVVHALNGGPTVIGIDALGRVAFGPPPDNPVCANQ